MPDTYQLNHYMSTTLTAMGDNKVAEPYYRKIADLYPNVSIKNRIFVNDWPETKTVFVSTFNSTSYQSPTLS